MRNKTGGNPLKTLALGLALGEFAAASLLCFLALFTRAIKVVVEKRMHRARAG